MCSDTKIISRFDAYRHSYRHYVCRCGRCPQCLKQDRREWCFRMLKEFDVTRKGAFVTLTYSSDSVPTVHHSVNGVESTYYTLCYPDVQKFLKRLRKRFSKFCPDCRLRFWCCGEYGKRKGRPHYHLLIFGLPKEYYFLIRDCWSLGFVYVGYNVSERTCNYVSKYVTKQGLINNTSLCGSNNWCDSRGVVRPFRHMSIGLGRSYLTPENVAYHLNVTSRPLELSLMTFRNGKKLFVNPILNCRYFGDGSARVLNLPLPRYYRRKIFCDSTYNCFDFPLRFARDFSEYSYKLMVNRFLDLPLNFDVSTVKSSDLLAKSEDYKEFEVNCIKDNVIINDFCKDFEKTDLSDFEDFELANLSVESQIKQRVPILNFN